MGKGDALETKKISLTLPNKLYEKIDKLDMPDAISVQDKIRRLLAIALAYMEVKIEEVMKKEGGRKR